MTEKHYAEVLIDGRIYTLGGSEEQQYLQRVASYINEKTAQMRRQDGFNKQSQEYQSVMIELNIADDYFKTLERAARSEKQRDDMEKETYSLKHELVTTQMNLEEVRRSLSEAQHKLEQAENELLTLRAMRSIDAAAASGERKTGQSGSRR